MSNAESIARIKKIEEIAPDVYGKVALDRFTTITGLLPGVTFFSGKGAFVELMRSLGGKEKLMEEILLCLPDYVGSLCLTMISNDSSEEFYISKHPDLVTDNSQEWGFEELVGYMIVLQQAMNSSNLNDVV